MQVEYDGKNAAEIFEFVQRAQEVGASVGVITQFEVGRLEVTLLIGGSRDHFAIELVAGDRIELGGNGEFSFHRKM